MSSKDIFIRGLHIVQALLGAYGATVSFVAINNLLQYEETAKKLAEWSDTAAHELHKTRTTQATGAIAIFASLIASLTLAVAPHALLKIVRVGISPVLLVAILFARAHIKNYWAPKDGKTVGVRIPLPKMEQYNEAQRQTQKLLKVLEYLEYSWVAASFVNGMLGA
ncbi:hypothetical protein AC578_2332 [Lecanosticta acicola]|uniref:Uncharacterized protein n=1 Tax=Lecanosticta acicola TaxID=111012 RepID=A0AAI9EDQ5_9PEZI|nr:hypothetical protein AC578_2332 [Lecanosticta acicola]